MASYLDTVDGVLKFFIYSASSYINHLSIVLSVHGNTKASASFTAHIFHAGTSFLKIIDKEWAQLYFPLTSKLPHAKVKIKYE